MKIWENIKIFFIAGRFFYFIAVFLMIIELLQAPLNLEKLPEYLLSLLHENLDIYIFFLYLSALIETVFVLSFYFPGSLILALAVVSLKGNSQYLFLATFAIWLGINTGALVNFALGKYFKAFIEKLGHKSFIQKATNAFEKYGAYTCLLFSIHPNYIGTLFLSFGLLGIKIRTFFIIAIISTAASITIWTLIIMLAEKTFSSSEVSHTYYLTLICVLVAVSMGFISLYKSINKSNEIKEFSE